MRVIKIVPYVLLSYFTISSAFAHEFWISPERFIYAPDAQVQVNLRVGQKFGGSAYSYNPRNFTRFDFVADGKAAPVAGRLGDIPAMSVDAPVSGLMTVIHETDDSLLSYTKWEKFTRFVEHKAFPTTLADHIARGIPKDTKFVERYRRFAKSLIAIGHGSGNDTAVGLRTEIIALENPYQTSKGELPVRVLLEGTPKPGTQIELFEKSPDGEVTITLHTTDAAGEANLPVKRGHAYLVDSVTMLALDNDDPANGPVWESLWASLTFMVPQTPLK